MTVAELRNVLDGLVCDGIGDCEVRFAYQPSWPLQVSIARVVEPNYDYVGHPDEPGASRQDEDVVYLVEGAQPSNPYPPAWVFSR